MFEQSSADPRKVSLARKVSLGLLSCLAKTLAVTLALDIGFLRTFILSNRPSLLDPDVSRL